MSADTVIQFKEELEELADLLAAAVVKRMQPARDEMTRRCAVREFGAAWLQDQEAHNRVRGRRKGTHKNSPILYSRSALLLLREGERVARMVRRR